MRRHGTGPLDRQDLLPAILACLGVGLVALENTDTLRGWYRRARGQGARPHLASACADLQANYEQVAAAGCEPPSGLATLDVDALSGNLVGAERELERAAEKAGIALLNDDIRRRIDAAAVYTDYQRAMLEAFDLPEGRAEADLSDGYLADILDELEGIDRPDQSGLVPMDGAPYHAEAHARRLDGLARELPDDDLGAALAHRPTQLVRIVEDGLVWLGVRESVYLKLGAHLNVPVIEEAVRELEGSLDSGGPGEAERLRAAFADLLAEAGFGGREPLSEEVTELTIGDGDVTVADVERSYELFASAFVSFLHAVDAAIEGDEHARQELWAEGTDALEAAHDAQPFPALERA